jgi:hypothetical protein
MKNKQDKKARKTVTIFSVLSAVLFMPRPVRASRIVGGEGRGGGVCFLTASSVGRNPRDAC